MLKNMVISRKIKRMKKYKLLRFGRCYVNSIGDLIIVLLRGDKKHGYSFAAHFTHPFITLGSLQIQSRIVPNDGSWREIEPALNVKEELKIRDIANPAYRSDRSELFDGDWMRVGEVTSVLY